MNVLPIKEIIIRQLNGYHGGKNGTDEIQEICDVIHGEEDGEYRTEDGCCRSGQFLGFSFLGQVLIDFFCACKPLKYEQFD